MYNKFAEFSIKNFKKPQKNVFIYALICPLTLDIKYVGKTTQGIERIRQHYYQHKKNDNSSKTKWIKSLRQKNLIFKVCYLEYINDENQLNSAEMKWIKIFKDMGELLFNHTEGGEVTYRPKYTEEDKRIISEKTKLAMNKPEVRENLRITHLGKASPMKGKHYPQEFKDKIHKANLKYATKVWDSLGNQYESILATSKIYKCPATSIKRILNTHLSRNGIFFYDHNPLIERG